MTPVYWIAVVLLAGLVARSLSKSRRISSARRILIRPVVPAVATAGAAATAVRRRGLRGLIDRLTTAWESVRGNLLYPFLFLLAYWGIGIVFYGYQKPLWEPWPKSPGLFFVWMPLAILGTVGVWKALEKSIVPLVLCLVALGFLGNAVYNAYSETKWAVDAREQAKIRKVAARVEAAKSDHYKLFWELPPGVVGAKEFPTTAGPGGQDVRIVRNDPSVSHMEIDYTHYTVPKTAVLHWDKVSDPDCGEWSQTEPANRGKWRIRPDPSGIGYTGEFTRADTGKDVWITMRLLPEKKP